MMQLARRDAKAYLEAAYIAVCTSHIKAEGFTTSRMTKLWLQMAVGVRSSDGDKCLIAIVGCLGEDVQECDAFEA